MVWSGGPLPRRTKGENDMLSRSLLKCGALALVPALACALAACGSGTVVSGPTPTPKVIQQPALTYMMQTGGDFAAWWSPDGTKLVSSGADATAQVWDASTGKLLVNYKDQSSSATWAAWSPDGKRIVTTSGYVAGTSNVADSVSRVWDAATGKTLVTYRGHSAYLNGAFWSPDGTRIVTTSADKTAQVWDASTGKTIVTYRGHTGEVALAGWSPDGKRIATASQDGTVQVWDAATGQTILTHHAPDKVWGVAWSPDGKQIASTTSDLQGQL